MVTTGYSSKHSSGSLIMMTANAGTPVPTSIPATSGFVVLSTGTASKGNRYGSLCPFFNIITPHLSRSVDSGAINIGTGTASCGRGGAIFVAVGSGSSGQGGFLVMSAGSSSGTSGGSVRILSGYGGTSSSGMLMNSGTFRLSSC